MLVAGAHDERTERPHLLMEQANCIVIGVIGAEAVGADHLCKTVRLVRRRRVAAAAHFAETHTDAGLGQLPGGFGPGQTTAYNLYFE